jgi:hypothetical protein
MSLKRKLGNNLIKTEASPRKREKLKANAFCKFCGETSLPGWAYLNHEMSKPWKVLWIIFLIAVCGISINVLVNTFLKINFNAFDIVALNCKKYSI